MKKFDFKKVAEVVKFVYHITTILSCIGGIVMWIKWWRDYKKSLQALGNTANDYSENNKWDLPDINPDADEDLVEKWEKSPENKWGFTRSDLVNGVGIIYDKNDDEDELY